LEKKKAQENQGLVINEVQLLLAEKRTALSGMRTGIAVFALPLSVLSILVATSQHYNLQHALPLLIPIFVLCAGLVVLGCYLVIHSIHRIHHYDGLISQLKSKYSVLADYLD